MRQLSILRVISVLVLFLFAGQVHAAEWRVVKIIGDAWVQSGAGAKKIAATRGLQLSGRTKIVTGRNGKVVLARGRESMIVGPGSRVDIPTAKNGRTLIRQDSGVVEYQARKRDIRHFEVRTPVLAAIVKGTKFTVTQNNRLAQVAVSEGAVQVVHFARGDEVVVRPGQKAVAGKRGQLHIVGTGAPSTRQASAGRQPAAAGSAGSTGPGGSSSGGSGEDYDDEDSHGDDDDDDGGGDDDDDDDGGDDDDDDDDD